ncbi:MAG: MraY family glycosyltransferase [Phycisphaerales bacterium]
MLALIAACLLISLALSAAGTAELVRFGNRKKLLDTPGSPGHLKLAVHTTPNIGGVAITLAIITPILAALLAANIIQRTVSAATLESLPLADQLLIHLPGIVERTPMALILVACLIALHAVGLIDDRRALPWLPKLAVQAAAAATLAIAYPEVRLLQMLDQWVPTPWPSIALTILWFLAITNAMNFLDNMDGLSAGVAAVASAFFLIAALLSEQWFIAAILALLIGALLGFLIFNFPIPTRDHPQGKARIFMGDSGSLVIGFLLAFLTVRTTYILPTEPTIATQTDPIPTPLTDPTWALGAGWAIFAPLCILAIPLYDLISVSAVRIAQGKSPLHGDQQHFSHRLRKRGLTVRQTLAIIYACTAITGIAGVMLTQISSTLAPLLALQVLLVLTTLAIWEYGSSPRPRPNADA